LYEWLTALPAFVVLVFVVVLNSRSSLHAQLLQLGESMWSGYFQLRIDPVQPGCNPAMDIDAELQRLIHQANNSVDEFDLFAPEPVNERSEERRVGKEETGG